MRYFVYNPTQTRNLSAKMSQLSLQDQVIFVHLVDELSVANETMENIP